jgi:hypothetical protein
MNEGRPGGRSPRPQTFFARLPEPRGLREKGRGGELDDLHQSRASPGPD